MQARPRVGEILVAAGIIDEMQLASALGEQTRWGKRLGVTLIKMGMVEEGHLIRALAKQLDLPVASLAGKRIAPEIVSLVPARVANEHGVIPLFTKDEGPNGQLYLGMEDPSNLAVLDDLSFRTGMEVRPVMVGPSELGEAIDRYYNGRDDASPQSDPYAGGDTMSVGSLRVVTDDSPQPGTAPIEPSIESEVAETARVATPPPVSQTEVAPAVQAEPEAAPAPTVSSPARASESAEAPTTSASAMSGPAPVEVPETLTNDVARAIEETERTRLVAKALTQLMIEKGLITLDELQGAIAQLKAEGRGLDATSD